MVLNNIIILFGIFLLCFFWIGLHYKIQSERQVGINHAVEETSSLARAFEEYTLRTIKSADDAVLFLKYQFEKDGRSIDIPRYIRDGMFYGEPFVQLCIINERGDLAATSIVPYKPAKLGDREHFRVHQARDNGRLFISVPVLGRVSGKWSLQMTQHINRPDGSFGGVAVVSVDPRCFTRFYRQVDLGKNSVIALIGRDGILRERR